VVLAGTGFFVYLQFRNDVDTAVDSGLRSRADELSAVVRREETSLAAHRQQLVGKADSFAEVLTPGGEVLDSSAVIGDVNLLEPAQLRAAARAPTFVTRGDLPSLDGGARLLAAPVSTPAGKRIVVVGASTAARDDSLTDLEQLLLIALPAALILASVAGYWVAAAALRPVEAMRARAEEITTAAPDERLPVPDTRDEVARLGETLNEMLARIGDAMERERAFVADASHELRTPLAILKAELELALREGRSVEELQVALRSAAEETDRLVVLAEDLLLIARSDQEALGLRVEPVDLGALARSTAERFAERASTDHRRVDVEIPPRTEVSADRLRLEQALRNLVDNALGYGEGRVTITTRDVGDAIEIHVLDEGEGFPPEVAARAFERFTRGDDARTRGGSGLGLAIVEAVAQAHGGSVGIAPNGNGADVWLSLPGHTIS